MRAVLGFVLLFGMVVGAVLGAGLALRDENLPEAGENVVLFSRGDPTNADAALQALTGALRVSTAGEVDAAARSEAVLVIDKSAFDVASGWILRKLLQAGVPIVGLNIPVENLAEAAGYANVAGQPDADFPPAPSDPYYGFVWVRTTESGGVYAGNGQNTFTSGEFESDLRAVTLASVGLRYDEERGDVVSFDEYTLRRQ